jgi:multiple RNA-binding domain-containing protein 1
MTAPAPAAAAAAIATPAVSQTRVCIKNLPPVTTEDDLKDFLREQAKIPLDISDCKILRNVKGVSRKVAFVGFRQSGMAKYTVENFHKTYLRTSRLNVELALAKVEKEPEQTKPDPKKTAAAAAKKEKPQDSALSRQKEEFITLMGGGTKSKFWANDEEGMGTKEPVADDDERADVETDDADESSSSSSDDDDDESMAKVSPIDKIEEKSQKKAGLTDMDFLRSKQKSVEDLQEEEEKVSSDSSSDSWDSSSSDSDDDDEGDDKEEKQEKQEVQKVKFDQQKKEESKMEENHKNNHGDDDDDDDDAEAKAEEVSQARLFVRNLPFATTEEELKDYFSYYGKILECHIPVDDQKRNKGFAFVSFVSAVDALEARTHLDKVDFQGRLLHILPARPPPVAPTNINDPNLTWKQKQELARREQETKSGEAAKGWSASFVRGDTVVDNLADRLGLRKGDVLGVKDGLSSGDAAVRLALGETQIIEENREYFKKHGVDMDALVSPVGEADKHKRSNTSVLVKNLPYDTKVEELMKLFHIGEEPVRILLPPSRTIALVEYGHSTDAKKAFRKLAYRRFKHVPIYLEWAPLAAKPHGDSTKGQETPQLAKEVSSNPTKTLEDADDAEEEESASAPTATLYIKNLNFNTTEENLRQLFEKSVGGVKAVKIPKKVAPMQRGGSSEDAVALSMGFGFVELESQAVVQKALKQLHGKLVDGHALELKVSSNKSVATTHSKPAGKNPTKLMVKNVPFQATRTELLKLFGTFGQLRKVRVPKKFDGTHRGFAFVEFLTSKEALSAMNALSRTHLYGRHLVLEWASNDDEDVDKLREKAKRDVDVSAPPKNKKIRFD